MKITIYLILLNVIAAFGSLAFMLFFYRILIPAPKQESIADLEAKQIKSASSFSRLRPNENLLDRFAFFILKLFRIQGSLEEQCMLLGNPTTPQPVDLLFQKIYMGTLIPLALALLFRSFWPLIFIPLAFFIPDLRVKGQIQKRQQELVGNFATMVDLLALVIESGLDYMTGLERIIKIARKKTLLEEEIDKTLNETKLGYSRREALERFSARTGVQDIRSFVGLIVQSDELGTSLVELLRNFSADLRFRRINKAEKLAAQASTKMLIPIFIFILPVVFILMLAPMLKDFLKSGMPF